MYTYPIAAPEQGGLLGPLNTCPFGAPEQGVIEYTPPAASDQGGSLSTLVLLMKERKKERKIVYFPNNSTLRISTYLINDTTVFKLKVEQSTN